MLKTCIQGVFFFPTWSRPEGIMCFTLSTSYCYQINETDFHNLPSSPGAPVVLLLWQFYKNIFLISSENIGSTKWEKRKGFMDQTCGMAGWHVAYVLISYVMMLFKTGFLWFNFLLTSVGKQQKMAENSGLCQPCGKPACDSWLIALALLSLSVVATWGAIQCMEDFSLSFLCHFSLIFKYIFRNLLRSKIKLIVFNKKKITR